MLRTAGENKWDSGLAGDKRQSHHQLLREQAVEAGRGRGTPWPCSGEVTEKGDWMLGWSRQASGGEKGGLG